MMALYATEPPWLRMAERPPAYEEKPRSAPPPIEKVIEAKIEDLILARMNEQHNSLGEALKKAHTEDSKAHASIRAELDKLHDRLKKLERGQTLEVAKDVLRDDGVTDCEELNHAGSIYKMCRDKYGKWSVIRKPAYEERDALVGKLAANVADLTSSNRVEHDKMQRRLSVLENRIQRMEQPRSEADVLDVAAEMLRERGVTDPYHSGKTIYELCLDKFGRIRGVSKQTRGFTDI